MDMAMPRVYEMNAGQGGKPSWIQAWTPMRHGRGQGMGRSATAESNLENCVPIVQQSSGLARRATWTPRVYISAAIRAGVMS